MKEHKRANQRKNAYSDQKIQNKIVIQSSTQKGFFVRVQNTSTESRDLPGIKSLEV